MPITVACSCGRVVKARDEHAGMRVRCLGCGAGVLVPIPERSAEQEVAVSLPVQIDATTRADDSATLPPEAGKRPLWKDPIVVIGSAVPALIVAAFLGYLWTEKSERDFRTKLEMDIAEADRLDKNGQLFDAHQSFDRLLTLAQDRKVDAETARELARARERHDALGIQVDRRRAEQAAIEREKAEKARLAAIAEREKG